MDKTNVMRLLDAAKIAYEGRDYDPAIVDGEGVAAVLQEDPDQVLKTLVCVSDKKEHLVFCIPVNEELNLKKAAKTSGSKAVELIPLKELLPLTGYLHGGCSPIGLKKKFPVYLDETIQLYDYIFVSAGRRGYQIKIAPNDLIAYCQAKCADLTR